MLAVKIQCRSLISRLFVFAVALPACSAHRLLLIRKAQPIMDQLLQFWSDKEMAAAFIHAHFTVVDMNTQDFIYQTNTSSLQQQFLNH
jgi:hypothetical protein